MNARITHIADLKVTSCTEPEQFSRHALNQLWHAQLAWYRWGPDVSNRDDAIAKLVSYANEEIAAAQASDDEIIRARRLDRARVFLAEALRACGAGAQR